MELLEESAERDRAEIRELAAAKRAAEERADELRSRAASEEEARERNRDDAEDGESDAESRMEGSVSVSERVNATAAAGDQGADRIGHGGARRILRPIFLRIVSVAGAAVIGLLVTTQSIFGNLLKITRSRQ